MRYVMYSKVFTSDPLRGDSPTARTYLPTHNDDEALGRGPLFYLVTSTLQRRKLDAGTSGGCLGPVLSESAEDSHTVP